MIAEGILAQHHPAALVLDDGKVYRGLAFGFIGDSASFSVGEVVFNTAISGYQEILTDPSYADQIITLTYPQIGNVGTNPEDAESKEINAKGLIIRQLPKRTSSWRANASLESFLLANQLFGLTNIDTRALTRYIREHGAKNGCIVTAPEMNDALIDAALLKAKNFESLNGKNLAKVVSTKVPYIWQEGGAWDATPTGIRPKENFNVVVVDFGVKKSILRIFDDLGCTLQVVPYHTSAQEILSYQPDGVFLSNGPGDPKACTEAIKTIQQLVSKEVPLFGICLGFQLLAIALGGKTIKMKFGHHGGNHPVQCNLTKQVYITSQNHGFAVDPDSLPHHLEVTHCSLFDQTLQGLKHKSLPIYGFQGHPEAGPGPNEAKILFLSFLTAMKSFKQAKQTLKQNTVIE